MKNIIRTAELMGVKWLSTLQKYILTDAFPKKQIPLDWGELVLEAGQGGGKSTMMRIILFFLIQLLLADKDEVRAVTPIDITWHSAVGAEQAYSVGFCYMEKILKYLDENNIQFIDKKLIKFYRKEKAIQIKNIYVHFTGMRMNTIAGKNILFSFLDGVSRNSTPISYNNVTQFYEALKEAQEKRFGKNLPKIFTFDYPNGGELDFIEKLASTPHDRKKIFKYSTFQLNPTVTPQDILRRVPDLKARYCIGE